MKLKELGETKSGEITIFTCGECGYVISATGLCNYECKMDGDLVSHRSPGTVILRVWNRVDTLIRQDVL